MAFQNGNEEENRANKCWTKKKPLNKWLKEELCISSSLKKNKVKI